MFGDLIFAFTPFGTRIREPYGGLAWIDQCSAKSTWNNISANISAWDNQSKGAADWEFPRKGEIPSRRCE